MTSGVYERTMWHKSRLNLNGLKLGRGWNKGKIFSKKTNCLCKVCSKLFYRSPCTIGKEGMGTFCSHSCKGAFYRGKASRGKPFKKGQHFSVNTEFKKGDYRITGERNKKWKGGISPLRSKLHASREWRDWRMMVFGRDNFTCKWCGKRNCYLEPHHIIPIRDDLTKAFEVNNGITLCRECHIRTVWKEEEMSSFFQTLLLKGVDVRFLTDKS